MLASLRNFGLVLVLIPLLLGISVLHTIDLSLIAPVPIEQTQTDSIPDSFAETLEEIGKEDDLYTRYAGLLLNTSETGNGILNSSLKPNLIFLVLTPPPDRA
ncbi:MAG: hypothetical protein R3283_03515 [Balneolaceae bacterium]|nr:hypothetical protein [Balneolaceae bacterium]